MGSDGHDYFMRFMSAEVTRVYTCIFIFCVCVVLRFYYIHRGSNEHDQLHAFHVGRGHTRVWPYTACLVALLTPGNKRALTHTHTYTHTFTHKLAHTHTLSHSTLTAYHVYTRGCRSSDHPMELPIVHDRPKSGSCARRRVCDYSEAVGADSSLGVGARCL